MFGTGMLLTESSGGLDNILASMDTVMVFGGKVLTFMLDNPALSFFFACSMVGAVVAVITTIKGAAVN